MTWGDALEIFGQREAMTNDDIRCAIETEYEEVELDPSE